MSQRLDDRLGRAWKKAATATVIVDGGTIWSGRDLQTRANILAGQLRDHDLRPGEPVVVQVANRAQDFAAFQAVWQSGGVVVPVHKSTPGPAVQPVFDATGARLLLDPDHGLALPAPLPPPADPLLVDAAIIVFTSASTGRPKGVVLSHQAVVTKLDNNGAVLDFDAQARTLLLLQITFSFGLWVSLLTMLAGGVLTVRSRFDVAEVLADLASGAFTRTAMVPTMLRAVAAARQEPAVHRALSAIRGHGGLRHLYTGGEILTGTLAEQSMALFAGTTLFNIFGLTETATSDFFLSGQDLLDHPGAIGRPGPGVDYRIADAGGRPCRANEVGELQIRSATLMAGYLGQPAATAAVFINGYLRTGDLARSDADGLVTVVGRAKEVISRGGNKVYPIEIEQVLQTHPAVAQALVTGVDDPLMGERIHAAIRLKPGVVYDVADLRGWAASRLEKFKLPDVVHAMAELPAGRTGKADRAALRVLLGER